MLQAVVDDPEGQLGSAARARFGDALPFLVKVLAAEEPLSLQAHPSAVQAAEGYRREERLGIPVNSPVRNYRDASHKPELLVALHQFEALAGFRPAADTIELFKALAVSDLDPSVDLLNDQSDADGLRALFTTWITAPQPDIDILVSRGPGRRHQLLEFRCNGIRGGSQNRAGIGGAVSRRCRRAGRAVAQSDHPRPRARGSTWRPEICTPTYAASAWR